MLFAVQDPLLPAWQALYQSLRTIPTGAEHANKFHRSVQNLLAAIFYPNLIDPRAEVRLHGGRKRIDITFTNVATSGFFHWVAQHYIAPHVFAECKNYVVDPANAELDQLAGRFSQKRGQVGFLVCRTLNDKELLIARCQDAAQDDRGFMMPLDDEDLLTLIMELGTARDSFQNGLLKQRFDRLVM